MTYSGLPRRKHAPGDDNSGRKSYLYYAQRRKLHLESGPTLPKYSPNTNVSAASVRGKWVRFCTEACLDPDDLLKNMTSADVKSWFDWIEKNFKGSIKAHSALANYWRTLKRLYSLKNCREMDADMKRDCLNYMNVVSSRMALRKHPLPKPTGQSEDLLQYLVSHLVDCDSVFADEKQRLYALSGLNLSCISASRAVSFFDTRHRLQFQADGTLVPPIDTSAKVRTPLSSIEEPLCDPSTKINLQNDDHAEGGSTSETSSYSDSEVDTASDSDHQSDCSSVTDDGKRYVIKHEDNLIFDVLSQLLALAIHDDIFEATIQDVSHIYTVPIPDHRKGIQLKIKREKLNISVFREPERTPQDYRTSDSCPLKSKTWSRYVKRIGVRSGQEHNLTQKVFRRGAINAINNSAPSSIRDQVADHESNAVKYYLNEIVDFDTAAAFHKRPSNKVVQRELRSATLLADKTAPIGLTATQAKKITTDPEVRRLRRVCRALTAEIRSQGYKRVKNTAGTEIDTAIFNQQYELDRTSPEAKLQSHMARTYQILERKELVDLLCYSTPTKTDEEAHLRRLRYIRLMIRWQDRKESPRRGKQSVTIPKPQAANPSSACVVENFNPLQCPFCLSDTRLSPADRTKRKSKTNKLWDHVERIHEQELAAFDSGFRKCGLYFSNLRIKLLTTTWQYTIDAIDDVEKETFIASCEFGYKRSYTTPYQKGNGINNHSGIDGTWIRAGTGAGPGSIRTRTREPQHPL
ncbi:hypothetical protein M747DRAFT_243364 [Aspergillus niger ATCC 13496]|uniref:Contig An04c0250, genomic contig n=3 Tax=Aspergillus niger TaxID=5061 RepID=A2QJR6_ASPNC|nr:uncharacterized protein An04g08000 [Aspergillus niger]RDH17175.1 hypothetical protein M747DRAFT_243364 [Aspergillus niger ATCC 13496]CAK47957.1 unnamed protein product [Aspergillus niger]